MVRKAWSFVAMLMLGLSFAMQSGATPYTMNVPGTSLSLPTAYPAAGGVAIVMVGVNGNSYFQFSNPTGAFQGFQNTGLPAAFRGNPFTINSPIALDCGASTCANYFGGSLAQVYVRFSAFDGDTGPGEFDVNDITLRLNGFDITNWSGVTTEITNTAGTVSSGFVSGFTNQTFNTGWFSSTNPALLANILSTGQTTSTVFDRDPNDNSWDFRIGNTLSNTDIITVAPGYELTKATDPAGITTYATVGQVINYRYVISNIGSVPIRNITLQDDKIGTVSCSPTTLLDVNLGQTPNQAICNASYTVTQADIDNRALTNIAVARGTPDFGTLGERRATLTLTGPALTPSLTIDKATTATAFGIAGTTVPYTFAVRNTGNATLTGVTVTDPLLPGLSCTVASLAPNGVLNCAGTYTVTQANVDAWARTGTQLSNTASVTSRDPLGATRTANDTNTLPGPTPTVTLTLDKVAQVTTFSRVGDIIPYRITLRNTGNTTWAAAPTVTDTLTTVACPAGAVAPGASIVCTSNYAVTQANIDAGSVANTANTSVTVGTTTGTATDTETINATRTTSMTLDKRLASTSPTSFNNAGVVLQYEFAVRNTGNVTLNSVAVTDPLATVTCPATTVAPGATLVCTASYTTTQANLDAGQVVNTAGVTARAAGTNALVTGPNDSQTVPATRQPALTMDKTAPVVVAENYQVGLTVTYSYLVTNTGNVALPGPILVQDNKAGNFQCQAGGLARGASVTCTRDYVLTSADVLAGAVQNTATGTAGTAATGITTSNQDAAQIAPTLNPAISLVKSATPASVSSTATTINYSFTITNTGNTQIQRSAQPIIVADPRVGTVTCPVTPPRLNPGSSVVCTASTTATQAELDAGRIINTATASFPFTNNNTTITISSSEATNTVTATQAPALTLTKTGPANFTTVGQVISYNFAVQNTGNVTLTTGSVTDPRIPALSCPINNLAPGATRNCTNIGYTVTQADIDAGQIVNTATATASTAQGGSATDADTLTTPIAPGAGTKTAAIDKVANSSTFTVGQSLTYTVRVSNTGTQTLSAITVTDPLSPGYTCTIPTLAPGVTSSLCTFNYTATQADVDAGQIVNTASAASTDFATITDSVTVTSPGRVARYAFTKVASAPFTAAGQVVDFTLRVRNTGTVTLTNVQITDAFFSPDLTCTIASLPPGADNASCVGSYTTTQADVDAGQITNTAAISVVPPSGLTATGPATATAVVPGPASAPAIVVTKIPSATSFVAGNTITYNFTVQNTGNVTLQNVAVSDAALGFSCTLANIAPGATATTCANAAPLRATRVMTQADVDNGLFNNVVSVSATSVGAGTAVTDNDEVTVVGPAQTPNLSIAKTGTPGTYATLGQTISYAYVVRNTGNVTLTAPITVADDRIASVSCPAIPSAGIPPNGTLTCTATTRITQANLDAGSITNTATASVRQPVVPRNPGDPTSVLVTSAPDAETVTANQTPALGMSKAIAAGSPRTYAAVGDQVTFEYTVTNTGNVTITDPITVVDNRIPGTLTCSSAPLAPGASVTCTQVWTATQTFIDAGQVTNTAVASTVYDGTTTSSSGDSVTVPALRTPELSIDKTLRSAVPNSFNVGTVLTYDYAVTNSGNVTITGPITVADNLTTVTCPPTASLAPAATVTCSATYRLRGSDLRLGSTTNIATGAGSFNGSPVRSTPDSVIYPVAADPALSIAKAITGGSPFAALNDVVTFEYTVTNSGGAGFVEDILVSDDRIGTPPGTPFVCRATTTADPFSTGDVTTCTASYAITQADLDRGFVTNTATARTVFARGGPNEIAVESPGASQTATAGTDPELTVTKSVVAGDNPASVGDVLTYRLIAENTGNQTISGVTLRDPRVPVLTCTVGGNPAAANVVLAPGASLVCEGTYTVTQANVDGQTLPNTATARGTNPQGTAITDTGDYTHPLEADAPQVTVTKAVTPDPGAGPAFRGPGDEVTFTVTVRNTGNVTLTGTTVTDDLVPGTCSVGVLAPGEQDASCQFTYVTTQADVDRVFGVAPNTTGGFINTATAVSQPASPGAPTVRDDGAVTVIGPAQEARLALSKEAVETSFAAAGDTISYRYIVRNAGNLTLTAQPVVTDDRIAAVNCDAIPAAGLLPGETVRCTASYTVTQADVDAGSVVNVASATSAEVPLPGTPGGETATETVSATRNPAATVAKVASIPTNAQVGDVITYTYTVANTGNTTLRDVTLTDDHTSAAGTVALAIGGDTLLTDAAPTGDSDDDGAPAGIWGILRPNDVLTFTSTYTVTQDDIDAGDALTNTVSVAATPPGGTTFTPPTDTVTVPVSASTGSMDVQKTADVSGLGTPPAPGDVVTYTITVENTGNITLSEPDLVDTLTDANGTALTLTTGPTFDTGDADTDSVLDVGETWRYTATVQLTQAIINAGGLSNSVVATARDPKANPVSDTSDDDAGATDGNGDSDPANDPTVTSLTRTPTLATVKSAVFDDRGNGAANPGDTITYTYTVENTGNVTVLDLVLTETGFTGAGTLPVPVYVSGGAQIGGDPALIDLQPGDIARYRVVYTLVQADIDAGRVTNQATATGTDPAGDPVTDPSGTTAGDDDPTVTIFPRTPGMLVNKTADVSALGSPPAVGNVLTYRITVANTGNVTLTTPVLTDTLTDANGGTLALTTGPTLTSGDNGNTRLDVGETWIYAATLTLTQGILDAGGVSNTVSATADDPAGDPVTDAVDNPVVTPLTRTGAMDVVKTLTNRPALTNPVVGNVVNYTITVANTGNVTLTSPVLTDTLTDGVGGALTLTTGPTFSTGDTDSDSRLDVGETWSYLATVTLTQAMIDSAGLSNSVTAAADDPAGTDVIDTSRDGATNGPTVIAFPANPAITVTKSSVFNNRGNGRTDPGDIITYTYTVRNPGNTTLFDIAVTETGFGGSGTTPVPVFVSGGGNFGGGAARDMRPGQAIVFRVTYLLVQADVDRGRVQNQATATGTTPAGGSVSDLSGSRQVNDTPTVTLLPQLPGLEIIKLADVNALSNPPVAGETVEFSITAQNTGNVTLTNVTITDTLTRNGGGVLTLTSGPTLTSGDGGTAGTLEVGETWVYTATYTLQQADIDAGGIANTATVRSQGPGGAPVSDVSDDGLPGGGNDPTLVPLTAAPRIAGEKTITAGPVTLGSRVEFLITARNTGNVTLNSVAVASDRLRRADGTVLTLSSGPTFDGADQGSPPGTLVPGETASYVASYVLVQADIDAGGINNSATVRGTPPAGPAVTDVTDDGDNTDGNTSNDVTELPIAANPSMQLVKRLAASSIVSFDAVGDVIDYEFRVTNTGNVTLVDQISIADPLITDAGGTITCPAPPVAPLATITCTGSYTITQADLDAGEVVNSATASDGATTSNPSGRTVPAVQTPGLAVLKTPETIAPAAFVVGLVVDYTYTVTNTGNVTITQPVTITDNLIDPASLTCPALPPGGLSPVSQVPAAALVCTGSYTVTSDDVDTGSVTNLASASDGTTDSPTTSATIPDATNPALTITKTAEAGATFAAVGDEIDYTFEVTNSGTRAYVRDVTVEDDRIGSILCFTATGPNGPDFIADETVTCTGTYTVTQDDLDAGQIVNEAFARTTINAGADVITSPPVTETVGAALTPELTVVKTATPNPVTAVGQEVTYDITVTNTGNQTIRGIEVLDPLLPDLACTVNVLAVGADLVCTDTYTVTQADIDRGTLVNTATATGRTPAGNAVVDEGSVTTGLPAADPQVTLAKTATPSPFGAVGSDLIYRFRVENTGNVTLADLVVTDPIDPAFSCAVGTLAPGAISTVCALTLQVTQAQVDAGRIVNTARVAGEAPNGDPISGDDTITTVGPARNPALEATKVLLPSPTTLGTPVPYELRVRNTGNVTLRPNAPVDVMTRADGTTTALDAPFALRSGDTDTDRRLDVGETWVYTATHTLTQADIDAGGLSNSVTMTARGPNNDPATDVSDNGNDGDGNTVDDPTVLTIVPGPELTVTKAVTAQDGVTAGDDITFTITALNSGNVSLTDVAITDTLTRVDGTALTPNVRAVSVPDPLLPGAGATWRVVHRLTQADIDAGGIRNTATVTGTDPQDEPITDVSADGDNTDGNTTDDPTEVLITNAPAIVAEKRVTSIGDAAGEQAIFSITVRNAGNVTLTDVTVVDTLRRQGGGVVRPVTTAFVSADAGSAEGTLLPGEIATYSVTYTLVQADVDAGGLVNTATATGTPPNGGPVTDISDDDGGAGENDPTVAPIVPLGTVAVTKAAGELQALFPTVDRVTFTITVENTGNVTQTRLRVADDLGAFLSPAQLLSETYPLVVTAAGFGPGQVNPGYDGTSDRQLLTGNATLAPGATGTISVTLVYSTAAGQPGGRNIARVTGPQLPEPEPSNPVTTGRADTDGDGVPDDAEGPGDRDGDGVPNAQDYDPTGAFYCEEDGRLLTGGSIRVVRSGGGTDGVTIVRSGTDGTYQFYVTAPGTYRLEVTYPAGGGPSTARPTAGRLDLGALIPAGVVSVGSSEAGDTGVLADGSARANTWYTTFVMVEGSPYIINNNIPVVACTAGAEIAASKTADRTTAVFGETINYTLTFANDLATIYPDATFVDFLPAGLVYTPGTARLSGTAIEPVIEGRRLIWGPRTLGGGETLTIRFAARVTGSAEVGQLENRVVMLDADGNEISNTASAVVQIVPEAIFDCSDVIGKVFEDRNGNGVQDYYDPRAAVTDQTYYADKYEKLGEPAIEDPLGEPGIPGVRVVTVNGLLITTDEYGRFHVPCAALPAKTGSNFTLKLDTRTLPAGFALTTENPRTLRLTAGKVAKMNFGVAPTELVDIALTAQAFVAGTTDARSALVDGVATLVKRIADKPSTLRLTYLMSGNEDEAGALARLSAVERLIRRAWRGVGSYDLNVQKSVGRVQ
jgi:large repetitive protein